jgi:hypothetical protein
VIPDTKNWTWVLERRCDDCGCDAKLVGDDEIGLRVLEAARVLAQHATGTARPRPDVWSPLEYACHVRDTCRVFLGRLGRMLTEDDPAFENWDQDATAVQDDYGSQDPDVVAREVVEAATALATAYADVPSDAWGRTGRRSDGARFTVRTLGQYLVHDPVHHVWDVTGNRST